MAVELHEPKGPAQGLPELRPVVRRDLAGEVVLDPALGPAGVAPVEHGGARAPAPERGADGVRVVVGAAAVEAFELGELWAEALDVAAREPAAYGGDAAFEAMYDEQAAQMHGETAHHPELRWARCLPAA